MHPRPDPTPARACSPCTAFLLKQFDGSEESEGKAQHAQDSPLAPGGGGGALRSTVLDPCGPRAASGTSYAMWVSETLGATKSFNAGRTGKVVGAPKCGRSCRRGLRGARRDVGRGRGGGRGWLFDQVVDFCFQGPQHVRPPHRLAFLANPAHSYRQSCAQRPAARAQTRALQGMR